MSKKKITVKGPRATDSYLIIPGADSRVRVTPEYQEEMRKALDKSNPDADKKEGK